MEGCSPCKLPPRKRATKTYVAVAVAVALGVATVVLAVVLPTVLCQPAAGSTAAGLAELEKVLAITNRSLAEARGQRDGCREQLGTLEGKVSELEQELTRVTQLQEDNRALKAEVAQRQEQLQDLRSSRDELQLQNQRLRQQLQDMRSQDSGGNGLVATSLGLLVLLLPAMLLL
ncbi:bone marrow stromal antigen 2-like [Nyctibius grandis]|uniref:bone marrow stromal antigen 2-like n=1 Tax=Nyctibius grandis TaxID=48427 RepID=UPI0035BC1E2F